MSNDLKLNDLTQVMQLTTRRGVRSKMAIIHATTAFVIPVIALRFVMGWKEIRANLAGAITPGRFYSMSA